MGMRQFIYTVVQQAVSEIITKEVNTRIDALERHITDVEKNLGQRITDVEKSLGQRITDVEKGLDQRIGGVEKNLMERFEGRFDNIERSMENVRGNLEGEARFFHLADYLKKQQSI
jgi:tetrahydromethanopterin S-methyltransferase subunit G